MIILYHSQNKYFCHDVYIYTLYYMLLNFIRKYTMKKLLVWAICIALSYSGVSAKFLYEEIDPVCSITGETYTVSAAWKSDTSSWSIPYAYDGECQQTESLSVQEKNRIYDIMTEFFEKNDFYRGWNTGEPFFDEALNNSGRKYIDTYFFPAVQTYISKAKKNNSADSLQVAIMNYAASIVGYDYYISQPE